MTTKSCPTAASLAVMQVSASAPLPGGVASARHVRETVVSPWGSAAQQQPAATAATATAARVWAWARRAAGTAPPLAHPLGARCGVVLDWASVSLAPARRTHSGTRLLRTTFSRRRRARSCMGPRRPRTTAREEPIPVERRGEKRVFTVNIICTTSALAL
jgi:hypothetical protein